MIEFALINRSVYIRPPMRQATPFFHAFKHLLFGRAPRSLAHWCASPGRAATSLHELRALFGAMIPDALLGPAASGAGSRQRIFSTGVTFWAFLSQVLSPDTACRHAVRKIQAWASFEGLGTISTSTAAYCGARLRLALDALRQVHEHLVDRLEANAPSETLWHARRIKIVDGTNLSMPDTPENQELWPQPSGQKPGCGFPMMKLVGLFSLASGALLRVAEGDLHIHESRLFARLWHALEPADVILADRGFCSFFALASLLRQGVDSVMRLHQARAVEARKGKVLGPGDRLVTWTKPAQRSAAWPAADFAALPATLTLRQITLYLSIPGYRTHKVFWLPPCGTPNSTPPRICAPSMRNAGVWSCIFGRSKPCCAWTCCGAKPRP